MSDEHGPARALVESALSVGYKRGFPAMTQTGMDRERISLPREEKSLRAAADALDAELSWMPPVNAELSELTITELIDRAFVAGMETVQAGEQFRSDGVRGQELLNEARHRDKAPAWPQGEQAAEALARVWQEMRNDERATYGFPRRSWETYSADSQAEFVATAAAVLAGLNVESEAGDAS